MKSLPTIMLILCSFSLIAQNKINNKIKEVKNLNIYGNGKTIIGKIIINQTIKTKIFLLGSSQVKDSSGNFTTVLEFGNEEAIPFFNGDFFFQFDQPVISVEPHLTVGMSLSYGLSDDHKSFFFTAGQINRPFGNGNILIYFTIQSATKVKVVIAKGVDGILK